MFNGSAGIGSGNYGGDGSNFTISSGNVSATGGNKATGIGSGEYFSGDGTVLADTDVAYLTVGKASQPRQTLGRLYLWLPQTSGGGSTNVLISKGAPEYSAFGQGQTTTRLR